MKIALCLYGLTGSHNNKWGIGKPLDPSLASKYYFKNLISANPNDKFDIFIHSQSHEQKKKLINIYQPKLSLIEKKKDFSFGAKKHPSIKYSLSLTVFFLDFLKFFFTFKSPFFKRKIRILKITNCYSRWYSSKMSVDLKKRYEKKKKFKYDMVFLGRLDMALLKPFRLSTFSKSYLTMSNSNYVNDKKVTAFSNNKLNMMNKNLKEPGSKINEPIVEASKKDDHNIGVHDFWFVGPSGIIDKFSLIYDRIEKYNINPHFTVLQHCAYMGIKITKKMYRWFDYELLRIKIFERKARLIN